MKLRDEIEVAFGLNIGDDFYDKLHDKLGLDELMGEFRKMIAQIQDATGDDFTKKWSPKITAITDKYLGKGKKVNDCTADLVEQLVLIVDDLKEAVGEGL